MKTACSWRPARILFVASVLSGIATLTSAQPRLEPPEVDADDTAPLSAPQRAVPLQPATRPDEPPYLGVTLEPRVRDAAVVRSVAADGPADQAGLQPGDTIEAVDGREVRSLRDLLETIDRMRPGDIVDIDFSRRISGRTQAVLAGRTDDAPRRGEEQFGTYERDRADRASYEELPSPPDGVGRASQAAPRRIDDPRFREADEDQEVGRDEPPRRGRWFDRDRPYRSRPLRPWRRGG